MRNNVNLVQRESENRKRETGVVRRKENHTLAREEGGRAYFPPRWDEATPLCSTLSGLRV